MTKLHIGNKTVDVGSAVKGMFFGGGSSSAKEAHKLRVDALKEGMNYHKTATNLFKTINKNLFELTKSFDAIADVTTEQGDSTIDALNKVAKGLNEVQKNTQPLTILLKDLRINNNAGFGSVVTAIESLENAVVGLSTKTARERLDVFRKKENSEHRISSDSVIKNDLISDIKKEEHQEEKISSNVNDFSIIKPERSLPEKHNNSLVDDVVVGELIKDGIEGGLKSFAKGLAGLGTITKKSTDVLLKPFNALQKSFTSWMKTNKEQAENFLNSSEDTRKLLEKNSKEEKGSSRTILGVGTDIIKGLGGLALLAPDIMSAMSSKESGGDIIGNFLAGSKKGSGRNAGLQAGKLGLAGLLLGGPMTGLLGAGVGAVAGGMGGEKIGNFFDSMIDMSNSIVEEISPSIKSISEVLTNIAAKFGVETESHKQQRLAEEEKENIKNKRIADYAKSTTKDFDEYERKRAKTKNSDSMFEVIGKSLGIVDEEKNLDEEGLRLLRRKRMAESAKDENESLLGIIDSYWFSNKRKEKLLGVKQNKVQQNKTETVDSSWYSNKIEKDFSKNKEKLHYFDGGQAPSGQTYNQMIDNSKKINAPVTNTSSTGFISGTSPRNNESTLNRAMGVK